MLWIFSASFFNTVLLMTTNCSWGCCRTNSFCFCYSLCIFNYKVFSCKPNEILGGYHYVLSHSPVFNENWSELVTQVKSWQALQFLYKNSIILRWIYFKILLQRPHSKSIKPSFSIFQLQEISHNYHCQHLGTHHWFKLRPKRAALQHLEVAAVIPHIQRLPELCCSWNMSCSSYRSPTSTGTENYAEAYASDLWHIETGGFQWQSNLRVDTKAAKVNGCSSGHHSAGLLLIGWLSDL